MYYWGFFRNNDTTNDLDGQLYKVVIITDYQSRNYTVGEQLLLTDSPFTVEYSNDDDNIFKPYKCSTATIGILQRDINYNFNTASGNNVLVKLLKYNNDDTNDDLSPMSADTQHFSVEWVGFGTPNAYSQGYETYYDEFELECQDALSTLKYYDYETMYSSATFCSFSDIVKKWCKFLNVYDTIYISDSVTIATTDFEDILHTCYIDERNFFDEDGKPMKVLDVFEQICTYLQLTCMQFGDSLYFLNYAAIRQGHNNYYVIKDTPPTAYDSEIEYLESTSPHNYIDTGFKPNQDTSVECVYSVYNINSHRAVFGCAHGSSGTNAYRGIIRIMLATGQGRIGFGNGSNTVVYSTKKFNDLKTEYKLFFDKNKCYFNGELAHTFSSSSWQSSYNLYLFARNRADANIDYPLVGYIKYCKIWDGDTLVRDYIPVRVGDVGYMFDKVSQTLYGNIGSGSFTLGGDVEGEKNYILQQSLVTLEHSHDILKDDFAANGTNLNLLTTYNKITVKDDFYPYDTIIPNLDETDNWEYTNELDTVGYYPFNGVMVVSATSSVTRIDFSNYNDNKYIYFVKYRNYVNDTAETYNTSTIKTYWYSPDELIEGSNVPQPQLESRNDYILNGKRFNYYYTQNYIGALDVQYQVSKVEELTDIINSVNFKHDIMIFTPMIVQGAYTDQWTPLSEGTQPMIEWETKDIALGTDNYIVISGKFNFTDYEGYLPTEAANDSDKMDDEMAYQWASLRCGNYWWDGSGWTENPPRVVKFHLPLKYEEEKNAFGVDIPILNNISWDMRLNTEGYAVKSPFEDGVHVATIRFVLYRPFGVTMGDWTRMTILRDFDIKIATENLYDQIGAKDDSNTEITNVITSGAVEEKDDIELKITTWDNKNTNYSSIIYNENFHEDGYSLFQNRNPYTHTFKRLQTIYNKGNGEICKPEEQIINNNVTQYSTPTTQITLNLYNSLNFKPYSKLTYHFFDEKIFIVDSMSIDYRYDTNTIKMTEIK